MNVAQAEIDSHAAARKPILDAHRAAYAALDAKVETDPTYTSGRYARERAELGARFHQEWLEIERPHWDRLAQIIEAD